MSAKESKPAPSNRWTIGKKLTAAFGAVASITLLLGIVGYHGALTSRASIEEIGLKHLPSVQSLQNLSIAMKTIDVAEEEIISPFAPADVREESHAIFASAKKEAESHAKFFESLTHSPTEVAAWEDFKGKWEKWWKAHENYVRAERSFVAFDIRDASALQRDLWKMRGAHLQLKIDIRDHLQLGTPMTGGGDGSQCAYGKWLSAFATTNTAIRNLVDSTRESHLETHALVAKITALNAKGEKDEALNLLTGRFNSAIETTLGRFEQIIEAMDQGTRLIDGMNEAMDQLDGHANAATSALASLVDYYSKASFTTSSASAERAALLKNASLGAMIVGVVLAIACGLYITGDINKTLKRIASSLHLGARQTALASEEVAAASRSLAEGASGQAASLEETSASIEELSSMTRRNAESARSARQLAADARKSAEAGSENTRRMDEVVKSIEAATREMRGTMDTAKDANDKVSKIIRTIDEIAFQTNILALNAAVEAARAGEAGKGFAVVADEVRALALKSAEAAQETARNIESAIQETEAGVRASEKVADRLRMVIEQTQAMDQSLVDIVGKAREVDSLVAQIAAASEEQSQGITQLNAAVGDIDKVTQANAAHAEESASAAQQMNHQANTLNESVEELLHLVEAGHVVSQEASAEADGTSKQAGGQSSHSRNTQPPSHSSTAPRISQTGSGRQTVPLVIEPGSFRG